MKIAVLIKQTPDTETKATITDNKLSENGVKFILNPYDEFAVEEALKLKADTQGTVHVLSMGPQRCQEAIRTALAMGCDEAEHIVLDGESHANNDGFIVSQALAKLIEKTGPYDVVFSGKQAIDDDAMAVPQMIAEHLSWPRATVVTHFEYNKDNNSAVVKRTIEGGKEESIELKGPFIVSANKGLNKPRYASLPGIMKAKKKTINAHKLEDLGVNSDDFRVEYFETRLPEEKAPGQIFKGDAKELAAKITTVLKDEVKVI